MKAFALLVAASFATLALAKGDGGMLTVTVTNPLDEARANEIVAVPDCQGAWLVHDAQGTLLPSQTTHDGALLFPATVAAKGAATYTLTPTRVPITYQTIACGRVYPERVDDVAWENDRVAFRAYGPALQKTGERAFGFDVWCKRATALPVVEKRYFDELSRGITYHQDHGNGLDCYKVGPSLGAGTPALLQDGALLMPWAYQKAEILDNGPLRFTVRLTYPPKTVGAAKDVVEERLISLDAGTHFNKTTVAYRNLPAETPLAVGLVLHDDGPTHAEPGLIAYADPTDRPGKNLGPIFVAALFPTPVGETRTLPIPAADRKAAGADAHLLGVTPLAPGQAFTYWWGAGWAKGDIPDWAAWQTCAQTALRRLRAPLQVSVKR